MQGSSCCIRELKMPKQEVSPKPMPRNLLIQMDNYMKDNKKSTFVNIYFLVDHKWRVWKGSLEIPCGWSYTWKHFMVALSICQKNWEIKTTTFWQIWWRLSWCHRNDQLSFLSWFKRFLISNHGLYVVWRIALKLW